ncbi:hypothetical protein AB1Y20_017454 [Prymnesium parvum]|uniref:NAD(P)-binding domain-containing protein n=1 Tax=Prymnesium parvum TaxID=97485 RepID=A0AB34JP78_PRYPA
MPLAPLLLAAALVLPPAPLLILGPGDEAVQLIAAKLAFQEGYASTHLSLRKDRALRLMFGRQWPPAGRRPSIASSNVEIGGALASAEASLLCIASNTDASSPSGVTPLLRSAPRLRRVVLLSAIGGSKGSGGLTYLGEGAKILECEREVRRQTEEAGVELSIVRVGVLKGGAAAEGSGVGLDAEAYYATLSSGGYVTPRLQCAREYDVRTLGVRVTAGDSIKPRSAFARAASQALYQPEEDEVSRINAASALIACLRLNAPIEISLSTKAAVVCPSPRDWERMLCL